MLYLNDIHVTFNEGTSTEVRALRGVDLHIRQGEFVTVIGSNGAGKSTLLSSIVGTVLADRGTMRLGGRDVTTWNASKRASEVGRVFQDPRLGTCSSLSIEENLALAAKRGQRRSFAAALSGSKQRARFTEKLAQIGLGLEERLSTPIGLLSGGQRQAVSLLMATLLPMKILLLAEHTAELDPSVASKVLHLSKEIAESDGLTVLMVTHSMGDALAYGSRTIMMDRGTVALDVSGDERGKLDIQRLLDMFGRATGRAVDSDQLILS